MKRRRFLSSSIGIAAAVASRPQIASAVGEMKRNAGTRFRIGLNAYSFDKPLMAGKMTVEDVVDFCTMHNIDGVDMTGYYFPGYPNVPTDEKIFNLKRKAYLNGVEITGTGVRNDFTIPDKAKRQAEIQLVKNWVEVAAKLGASVVRVFSGPKMPEGYTFDQVFEWMAPAFQECVEHGKKHGVMIGLQHHDDYLKTADQTIRVVKAVNSEWFGVILDVGSVRQGDPYVEIEKLLPYACTWQIKEQVYFDGKATPIDLARLRKVIDKVGFRGFLPFEALGRGEPEVVTAFLEKVRKALA